MLMHPPPLTTTTMSGCLHENKLESHGYIDRSVIVIIVINDIKQLNLKSSDRPLSHLIYHNLHYQKDFGSFEFSLSSSCRKNPKILTCFSTQKMSKMLKNTVKTSNLFDLKIFMFAGSCL